jgi:hypothetical protein
MRCPRRLRTYLTTLVTPHCLYYIRIFIMNILFVIFCIIYLQMLCCRGVSTACIVFRVNFYETHLLIYFVSLVIPLSTLDMHSRLNNNKYCNVTHTNISFVYILYIFLLFTLGVMIKYERERFKNMYLIFA